MTPKALLHGASPVEYRLDRGEFIRPKLYSTGRVTLLTFSCYLPTVFLKSVVLSSVVPLSLYALRLALCA